MPQSLCQIYAHIVFSTQGREPYLEDKNLRERLHAYLVGTCNNLVSPSLCMGGVEDHIHILCRVGKTIAVSQLVRELKRESSKWVKIQSEGSPSFYWQKGYGAFSISPAHVDSVIAYIAHQEEHHRAVSFQDEFRTLCRKYGVELDERYAWD
jgi:putative transposase